MGEVFKTWVRDKLGLPIPSSLDPDNLCVNLSNGYLFAEILRKFSIISDDQLISLGHSHSAKMRKKNMTHLYGWLTDKGMDVKHEELLGVFEQKPGAAIGFMYKLFFLFEDSGLTANLEDAETLNQEECLGEPEFVPPSPETLEGNVELETVKPPPPTQAMDPCHPDRPYETWTDEDPDKHLYLSMEEAIPEVEVPVDPATLTESLEKDDFGLEDLKFEVSDLPEDLSCPCQGLNLRNSEKDAKEFPELSPEKLSCEPPSERALEEEQLSEVNLECLDAFKKLEECPKNVEEKNLLIKGDNMEVINYYFVGQAVDNIRKVEKSARTARRGNITCRKTEKEEILVGNGVDGRMTPPREPLDLSDLWPDTEFERKKAKLMKEYRLSKEMESYDLKMQQKVAEKPYKRETCIPEIKTDFKAMHKKIDELKCTRKEASEAADERTRLRKALAAKMLLEIPTQIIQDLNDYAMKKTMAVCGKEQNLADYMGSFARAKEHFYDHVIYRTKGLQMYQSLIEDRIEDKKMRDLALQTKVKETSDKLMETVHQLTQTSKGKDGNDVGRMIVEDLIYSLSDMATKIAQFHSAIGTPPPEDAVEAWKESMFAYKGKLPMLPDIGRTFSAEKAKLEDYEFNPEEWGKPTDPDAVPGAEEEAGSLPASGTLPRVSLSGSASERRISVIMKPESRGSKRSSSKVSKPSSLLKSSPNLTAGGTITEEEEGTLLVVPPPTAVKNTRSAKQPLGKKSIKKISDNVSNNLKKSKEKQTNK